MHVLLSFNTCLFQIKNIFKNYKVYIRKFVHFRPTKVDMFMIQVCIHISQGCQGYFGSDSSKSTKFGPEIAHAILFRFLMGAKTGASRGRHIGEIQNGHHPGEMSIVVQKLKGLESRMIHQFRGVQGLGSQSRCCFNDLKLSQPNGAAILEKSNMVTIQLDVNHRYNT